VLDLCRDDVIPSPSARLRHTAHGQVGSLGAPAGEDYVGGAAVQDPRQRLTRALDVLAGLPRRRVLARGYGEALGEIWPHDVEHF
jgi:hypothetical protein